MTDLEAMFERMFEECVARDMKFPLIVCAVASNGAIQAYKVHAPGRALWELAGHSEPAPGRRARRFAAALSGLPLEPAPVRAGDGHAVTGGAADLAARGLAAPGGILAHLSALNLRHKLIGAA